MNQQLIAYVKSRARDGASEKQIRLELEKAGWGEGAIDDAFKYVPGLKLRLKHSWRIPSKKVDYVRAKYTPPPVLRKVRSIKGPLALVIFLLILIALGGYYVFVYKKNTLQNNVETQSGTPAIVLPSVSTSTASSSLQTIASSSVASSTKSN